jgi:hypothetical protein
MKVGVVADDEWILRGRVRYGVGPVVDEERPARGGEP